MKPEYILAIVAFVAIWIGVSIADSIKKKKGRTGEDQKRILDAARKELPDCAAYTVAYAQYFTSKSRGNHTTSYYYNYIVAFRPGEMVVIPIKFAGKEIVAQEHFLLNRENVSNIKTKNHWTTFLDTNGEEICSLGVSSSNTADGKYFPLNIQQPEEAEKFQTFLDTFIVTQPSE